MRPPTCRSTRRAAVGRVGLALVALLVAGTTVGCGLLGEESAAKAPTTAPCAGPHGVGSAVPAGLGPGDLVASRELTGTAYVRSPGFPHDARVFRTLSVSSGLDAADLHLVCGLVVAPAAGPRVRGGTGRMLAWAHGTIGLSQECQPSGSTAFWGEMPGGIGAIAWGAPITLDEHRGRARDGMLQWLVDQGWVVAATDYQPPDTYLVGRIAAANVLDQNRAAAQLVARAWPQRAPDAYRFVVSGHSQGGHSAVFTGQLAEPYLASTHPSRPTASFTLVGVDAEAPATNLVADPAREPGLTFGDGLADSEVHQTVNLLPIDVPALSLQVGPALFSYLFGAWAALSRSPVPPADTDLPAIPDTGPLDLLAIATAEGEATVTAMGKLCLSQERKVQQLVSKYRDARAHAMLVPPIWNVPADYTTGEWIKGGFDRTCATTTDSEIASWCTWVRWNTPGPIGVNPYPKAPSVGGALVPVLIAQGQADNVVNCIAPSDLPTNETVGAPRCSSRTLYDALASTTYCPPGSAPAGSLQMDLYRRIRFRSPADHVSIRGQASSAGEGKRAGDLTFARSRLQRFLDQAVAGTVAAGCSIGIVNGG